MAVVKMPDGTPVDFGDMPPEQIKSMILQKFPDAAQRAANPSSEYQDKSIGDVAGEAIRNIPSSAVENAKNLVQPILHPIDTANSLKDLAVGALQKAKLVDGEDRTANVDALVQHFADRYGSVSGFKKAVAQDPVGVALDISTVLTAGGSAAARLPGVAGKVGEIVKTAGDVTNPLNAVGAAAKVVGKTAAHMADATTGSGYANIVTAAEAGGKGISSVESNAFWSNMAKQVPMEDVVKEAQSALGKLQADAGKQYRAGMAEVSKDATVLSFKDIDAAVTKMNGVKTFKGIELSPETKGIRDKIGDAINEWKALDPKEYHTPEGLDALKQQIGDIKDATELGTPSRLVADQIYSAVRKTVADQAPVYDKTMKGYAEAKDELAKISKELSLGKNVNPGTALRKLQSVMRDGVNTSFGYRQQLMEKLVDAGAETLPYAVAGQQMGAILPRGIVGRSMSSLAAMTGLGGAGAHLAGAAAIPAVVSPWALAALPAASPAVVGTAAYGAGLAGRVLGRPNAGLALAQTGRATR